MTQKIQNSFFTFIFFGFIAFSLFGAIASNFLLPSVGDFLNHITAIVQAKWALQAGQFPLRIAPLEHHGWGYPIYQFYASTPYTLTALLYRFIIPGNAFIAYKCILWGSLLLGALYIYRLMYWLIPSHPIALLTGAQYLLSPYFILLINSWGGFTETIALSLLPATVYYLLRICRTKQDLLPILFSSLTWYALITTHPITFVYSSLLIGIFVLLLLYYKIITIEKSILVATAYFFGCLLALWVLDPLITLGGSLEIKDTLFNPGQFHNSSLLPAIFAVKRVAPQYILDNHPTINPAFGWPALLGVFTCAYAYFSRQLNITLYSSRFVKPLLLLFLFAFFLVWSPLPFWPLLPKFLRIAQYCWRLIGQGLWVSSLLFGCALYWLFGETIDKRHILLGTLLLGISAGSWIPLLATFPKTVQQVTQKPSFGFSQYDYMLSPKDMPVTLNETLIYELLDKKNILRQNQIARIPSDLLQHFPTLFLRIESDTPTTADRLNIFVDKKHIASRDLSSGSFSWDIPIATLVHPSKPYFTLQLTTSPTAPLTIKKIGLTHFDPHLHLMPVQSTESFCEHRKGSEITDCTIPVPRDINMLELPTLYYPGMLKGTLNDQPITLQPILNDRFMLAGVRPLPGIKNHIVIYFTGISSANRISFIAWLMWGALLIFALRTRQKQ